MTFPQTEVYNHLFRSVMNIDNAKSQMRKGMLEYCVLLLLRRQPSYANDIIKQLKDADLIVVEGTLYPLLSRLKKDGLLTYEWKESFQGPPRKYYAMTEDGAHMECPDPHGGSAEELDRDNLVEPENYTV